MEFLIFLVLFALFLAFIFWLFLRLGKSRPSRKPKRGTKKSSIKRKALATPNRLLDSERHSASNDQVKEFTKNLLKKNPEAISQAIRKWLRKK